MIGLLGSNLGGLLYGISTYRAGIFPRWAAILIFGGVLATFALTGLHSRLLGEQASNHDAGRLCLVWISSLEE